MGMTIDYCVNELLLNKEDDTYVLTNETTDFVINIMRKYQKIERIIDDWNNQKINNIICCLDIKEVVEDGNDD